MRSQLDDSSTPVPLGPDSLTWKYFGDWRGMLQGVWAGSMQNMHPGLGAGVEEHSQFFDERWERLYRSLYPIAGVVFDGDRAQQTAEEVRGYHTRIKGVDKLGVDITHSIPTLSTGRTQRSSWAPSSLPRTSPVA